MSAVSHKLLDVLEQYGTLVFGKSDCKGSEAMKVAMRIKENMSTRSDGSSRPNGPHFICCDATPEETALCDRVGVSFAQTR